MLSLVYLSQTSDIAASGYDIASLQAQREVLEMQNEQLRFQVAQLQSLDRIDREASSRLHMGPPEREIFISAPPVEVATPRPSPTPVDRRPEQRLESPWQLVQDDIRAFRTYLASRCGIGC